MGRTVRLAVVQMDASPAPLGSRLARAEAFVTQCAAAGARLVVLPELFNTGYEYSRRNYALAEPLDGPTATWMRRTAARSGLHLAGTFLRRDSGRIFNTLLLAAPDGREWRYDKNYPWMWERAYFEKGAGITVAETGLGAIGLLICWDVGHLDLWRRYSGKVDLLVVCSCPPRAFDLTLALPDGQEILGRNTGALVRYMKRTSDDTYGALLRRQSAFLGVPLAQATGTGLFRSPIPAPKLSLALLSVLYPPLWKHRTGGEAVCVQTRYFNESYIADGTGTVVGAVPAEAEGLALAEVALAEPRPAPAGSPPAYGIPGFSSLFDSVAGLLLASEYRRNCREARSAAPSG